MKLETIFQSIGYNIKLSYKLLLFGYRAIYPAYATLNTLLSSVFLTLYKYWLHDNVRVDVCAWIFSHLNLQKKIYKELNAKEFKLFDDVLKNGRNLTINHHYICTCTIYHLYLFAFTIT